MYDLPLYQVQRITLENPRLSNFGRALLDDVGAAEDMYVPIMGAASFSDYLELKVLDHVNGKTSFTMPATPFLALCTTAPDDTKTGTTIVEAGYTGYARKSVAGSDWNAAAAGSASNLNAITFAACTGSTSTIVGWAYCDASTVGNVIYWGTATSTVISTTQTPATIAAAGLVVTLD